jgi:hypothetical protein
LKEGKIGRIKLKFFALFFSVYFLFATIQFSNQKIFPKFKKKWGEAFSPSSPPPSSYPVATTSFIFYSPQQVMLVNLSFVFQSRDMDSIPGQSM